MGLWHEKTAVNKNRIVYFTSNWYGGMNIVEEKNNEVKKRTKINWSVYGFQKELQDLLKHVKNPKLEDVLMLKRECKSLDEPKVCELFENMEMVASTSPSWMTTKQLERELLYLHISSIIHNFIMDNTADEITYSKLLIAIADDEYIVDGASFNQNGITKCLNKYLGMLYYNDSYIGKDDLIEALSKREDKYGIKIKELINAVAKSCYVRNIKTGFVGKHNRNKRYTRKLYIPLYIGEYDFRGNRYKMDSAGRNSIRELSKVLADKLLDMYAYYIRVIDVHCNCITIETHSEEGVEKMREFISSHVITKKHVFNQERARLKIKANKEKSSSEGNSDEKSE